MRHSPTPAYVYSTESLTLAELTSTTDSLRVEWGMVLLHPSTQEVLQVDEFRYELQWREGDLALWDNHCTVHGRQEFEGERVLWRTQARGPW